MKDGGPDVQALQGIIAKAIHSVDEMSRQKTDGKWLEDLVADSAALIAEWDIYECWKWSEWPERDRHLPQSKGKDTGIDVVALRGSDGVHIAIQCKARALDDEGRGNPITKHEVDSFASMSSDEFWAERWIVTNGDNPLGTNAMAAVPKAKPIKLVNIDSDLQKQEHAKDYSAEVCPHCSHPDDGVKQTRSCMQNEAVYTSLRILMEHERSGSGGPPVGEARGKIILPCGTGKTRISLRIIETLTEPGDLAVVLCPSIALVAQIRREFLVNAKEGIRSLAVCSDETAGYDRIEGNSMEDPTIDMSRVSASEVKGMVTTDSNEIAQWIRESRNSKRINVIFGTYQSSHKVGEALLTTSILAQVLVADEAHRTAGLRRNKKFEERLRDFTVCHDNERFPVRYRVYQTATPRVYDTGGQRPRNDRWVVRNMDDEAVFGVELYRKSYMKAVTNGWLTDYRIIALGVNDQEAYKAANKLAQNSNGNNALSTTHFLRGLTLALVLGGATRSDDGEGAVVKSCIAFMNTVNKSKSMAQQLQSEHVRNWVQEWLWENRDGRQTALYTLEHLDASSNVTARENAKSRLAKASADDPHGILNVGIFGEGTDAPSLSAVAFLEARKSPIDVIQAVGRAMRLSDGKSMGYIICPIIIPPFVDAERWLKSSGPNDGWQELGQILLALRAHDSRIEDNLSDLLQLYLPPEPETESTMVAIAGKNDRISYHGHHGIPGQAQSDIEDVLNEKSRVSDVFVPLDRLETDTNRRDIPSKESLFGKEQTSTTATAVGRRLPAPGAVITGKVNEDRSVELRINGLERDKSKPDGTPGPINLAKSKRMARRMINEGQGSPLPPKKPKRRRTAQEVTEDNAMRMLNLSGMDDHGRAIVANLLSKSGLRRNRVTRDLNILEGSVIEASRHLREDTLDGVLDKHFGLDNLDKKKREAQADGCTIGALLMMNAAMLHQRIASGQWLSGMIGLAEIKNESNVVKSVARQWNTISRHDFLPILQPAIAVIETIEDTGKLAGLERAVRHIASEAERIAETYADMGADHAGPLFNRVMGNQASDGAYFTRPVAASIAARLALDTCGDVDWAAPEVWREFKVVDLACGSGTLLAATMTDMKRRASEHGAPNTRLAELQKIAVEETIKGLDINPVSLQLAASQLTAGNQEIRYRQMGLHLMPYGPQVGNPYQVSVGTLELFGQKAIVPRGNELDIEDYKIVSRAVWQRPDNPELEDAVTDVQGARIVIMNPPFTNRTKMGEKFPKGTQLLIRSRTDELEQLLVRNDRDMDGFVDKNSLRPLFVALADQVLNLSDGVLVMVHPTIALTTTSGQHERRVLARRYHINTVLTCHLPGQINLSQNTNINESILIATRYKGPKPPTRFINLDRMPTNESEVDDLHRCLSVCSTGLISNGWGEVSEWPACRIEAGDWTAAIWRSPKLAEAAVRIANDEKLLRIADIGLEPAATGQQLRGTFENAGEYIPGSFPILKSKGADGQLRIESTPDEYWIPKRRDEDERRFNDGTYLAADKILQKAGYLLITTGQDNRTARLTAVASDQKFVGNGWMPVIGLTSDEAKAAAVFINSTAGRLQLMRNLGRKLEFPTYSAAEVRIFRIPDIKDPNILEILVSCWNRTKDMVVPQFRDGECEVRRLWDEAVADALAWDADEMTRLRELLSREPHVRGLGYNQHADELDDTP